MSRNQRGWGRAWRGSVLVVGMLLATMAAAKTPAPASVDEAMAYYDQWLQYQRDYLRVPGIQAAVRVGDELVFSHSYGMADVEKRVALRNDHLFRIASHSKTFTAIALMRLAEQGKLRLDDSAGRWLPWLQAAGSPLAKATIAELMSHSAGVTRDGRDSDFWQLGQPFPDREQLRAELLASQASVIPANQHFKYSNIGYSLLGLVIEAATGEDYNAYVQREIVDRLGLKHMGPEYDPGHAAEYATGYSSLLYADHRVPIDHVDTEAMSAATGFYANAEDLTRYFTAYYFGNDALIGDESKRRMQHPVWFGEPGEDSPQVYGLGLRISRVGERTLVGHSGGYPGHITISMTDPKDRIAVSVLTNTLGGPAQPCAKAAYLLMDLAQRTRDDATRPAVPAGVDPARFAGRYVNLWGVMDVAVLGGRPYMLSPGDPDPVASAVPLTVIDGHTLRVDGGSGSNHYSEPMVFDFAADGSVASVRLSGEYLPIGKWKLPERVRQAR